MSFGRARILVLVIYVTLAGSSMWAQDLGPHFRKIKEGIYVQSAREVNSNSGIILTKEGVVIIDTGQTPTDSREVEAAVRKLTALPVRVVINTEVHPDHTTGNFVFSPPALVVNHEGAAEAMRQAADPNRIGTLRSQSTEMRDALEGYRLVTPHFEYHDKATLHVGERTFELLHLKNVHSEADTARLERRKSSMTASAIMDCSSSASAQWCARENLLIRSSKSCACRSIKTGRTRNGCLPISKRHTGP